ncbi:MAG: hypothetical protein K9M45_13130, partial [Kiritimatiellales bacterium]|nr:hypothetical protein [Kiritimatiellales bacterium]
MTHSTFHLALLCCVLPLLASSAEWNTVKGPQGIQSEQLRFWEWEDNTLLDLRGSVFQALENGPFMTRNLPAVYPSGDALKELE